MSLLTVTHLDTYSPGNAISHIKLEVIKFSGGLKYDDDGRLYRNVDSSQVDYVGKPSPEMDKAWHSLVDGKHLLAIQVMLLLITKAVIHISNMTIIKALAEKKPSTRTASCR